MTENIRNVPIFFLSPPRLQLTVISRESIIGTIKNPLDTLDIKEGYDN